MKSKKRNLILFLVFVNFIPACGKGIRNVKTGVPQSEASLTPTTDETSTSTNVGSTTTTTSTVPTDGYTSGVYTSDSFTRSTWSTTTDIAAGGIASTWGVSSGATPAIGAGSVFFSGLNPFGWIATNTSRPNCVAQLKISTMTTSDYGGLMFRSKGGSDSGIVLTAHGPQGSFRIEYGTSPLASLSVAPLNNDILRVVVSGGLFSTYYVRAGITTAIATNITVPTALTSGTYWGIYAETTSMKFDDFLIESCEN